MAVAHAGSPAVGKEETVAGSAFKTATPAPHDRAKASLAVIARREFSTAIKNLSLTPVRFGTPCRHGELNRHPPRHCWEGATGRRRNQKNGPLFLYSKGPQTVRMRYNG